jgi:geranylgeranylglycerol-phosphate geranylgeranyltransferase
MAAVAVLVGAFVSTHEVAWWPAVWGAAAAFAAAGAANALNDRMDVAADRINRPDRPVPSARVSLRAAVRTACWSGIAAVALAAGAGLRAVALVLAWLVLTALYSLVLKGIPLVGNVAVALVASTPFLMGGFSQGRHAPALVPCALAFLVHLAREIVKDVEDAAGDEAAGVRTLAVRLGATASFTVARGVMVVLIGLAAMPFALGLYGWGYAVVVVLIDVVLVWLLKVLGSSAVGSGVRSPSNLLKVVMALGLVAFVLGVITR